MPHNYWIVRRWPEDARQAIKLAELKNPARPAISNALWSLAKAMGAFEHKYLDASVVRLAHPVRKYSTNHAEMRQHSKRGNAARWGDHTERHAKAREMRATGATLKQIAAACGWKSVGSVAHALKGTTAHVE
jgi:hypothetical protein